MALDSMYKFKEIKKIPEEKKETDYKKMSQELKQMTASLMAGELDQQWIWIKSGLKNMKQKKTIFLHQLKKLKMNKQ